MISIDGSQGEGGGQIFRSSLTLAMCLGQPVRVINIRAGRNKPGLLRQHLTCLGAAQMICSAEVQGGALGSTEVTFQPGVLQGGNYHFAVGSAGSSSLVLQTILLPLLYAAEPSVIKLEGGTHNGFAPSYDFIASCFFTRYGEDGFSGVSDAGALWILPCGWWGVAGNNTASQGDVCVGYSAAWCAAESLGTGDGCTATHPYCQTRVSPGEEAMWLVRGRATVPAS